MRCLIQQKQAAFHHPRMFSICGRWDWGAARGQGQKRDIILTVIPSPPLWEIAERAVDLPDYSRDLSEGFIP